MCAFLILSETFLVSKVFLEASMNVTIHAADFHCIFQIVNGVNGVLATVFISSFFCTTVRVQLFTDLLNTLFFVYFRPSTVSYSYSLPDACFPLSYNLDCLKEHYRIGFAYKTVAGSIRTYVIHNIHKLTNLLKFEIDRPSGSRESSEKLITHFARHRCKNKN